MITRSMLTLASVLLSLCLAGGAAADGPERVPPVKDPVVLKECGGCHMAFQPAFLPAASWRAMMKGLSGHFGEDASLPPDKVKQIEAYLVRGAGRDTTDGAPLRITELRWWKREHDASEVPPDRWKDPKVASKANCPACHLAADQGNYEEEGERHEGERKKHHEEDGDDD